MMERDDIREQFWAAFDAFIPGMPDEVIQADHDPVPVTATVEEEREDHTEDADDFEPAAARRHEPVPAEG
jgi:lysophospholipase